MGGAQSAPQSAPTPTLTPQQALREATKEFNKAESLTTKSKSSYDAANYEVNVEGQNVNSPGVVQLDNFSQEELKDAVIAYDKAAKLIAPYLKAKSSSRAIGSQAVPSAQTLHNKITEKSIKLLYDKIERQR